jgi:molybdopterin converting factor small subunit
MRVSIHFYSYFKELTGCAECSVAVEAGASMEDLLNQLIVRFPRLEGMQKSTLLAVGVDYQSRAYRLQEGDQVSLFPPVQGG